MKLCFSCADWLAIPFCWLFPLSELPTCGIYESGKWVATDINIFNINVNIDINVYCIYIYISYTWCIYTHTHIPRRPPRLGISGCNLAGIYNNLLHSGIIPAVFLVSLYHATLTSQIGWGRLDGAIRFTLTSTHATEFWLAHTHTPFHDAASQMGWCGVGKGVFGRNRQAASKRK